MHSLHSSPVVHVDFEAPSLAEMVDFKTTDVWQESGNVQALATVTWEDASMESMDCELRLADQKDGAQKATYLRHANEKHFFRLSSNMEGNHSFAITCCNPLMKTVFRDKPSYRKIMCDTTRAKDLFMLDATAPEIPEKYKNKMPTTLLTTAEQCQSVTFDAFADTAGLDRYTVEFISQVDGQTLVKTIVPPNTCSAAEAGKPAQCETCVPLATLSAGDQGLVLVTAFNSAGLTSSANVARFVNDHTAVRVGRLRLDDIKINKATKDEIKLSASVYWNDISFGDTGKSAVRVCAQLQDLARHPETSASGLPRAFAIEVNRRVRRQLQSVVDRPQEKSSVCEDVPPEKTSHTFELSLHYGPENNAARYSIVTQIEATAKSGRKNRRLEHKDIRIFAPFSGAEELVDSLQNDIDFTADTKRVEAHFRSVSNRNITLWSCLLVLKLFPIHLIVCHGYDVDLVKLIPQPSCALVVGRSASYHLRPSPWIPTLQTALSRSRGSRPRRSESTTVASGCRLRRL